MSDLETLMASMRLVLPGCNEIQIKTAIALVRSSLTEELKEERTREMAAARKRRQRDRDRDIERDSSVTDGVTVTPVSPTPPSGSSLDLIPSSPDPSEPDPEKRELDERPGPVTRYSSDFIAFWMAYPRRVGKEAAWKAWKRQRPSLSLIQGALVWQRVSKKWRDGFIMNPATYINGHHWLDERDTSVTASVTSGVAASPLEAYCDWHRTPGNDDRPSHRSKATCPSCKHLAAKTSHRPGGVSAISNIDDPLPDWAERSAK